jgi:hypothetical protein
MFALIETLNHEQAIQSTLSFSSSTLLVSTALSQQSGPANEKELKLQRLRLQAISMIKQTASEAPLWDNKKAAALSLADAADLLWDEKSALTKHLRRILFGPCFVESRRQSHCSR